MKAIVCLLFIPAALAVWILGSPQTAYRVFLAFRRGPKGQAPSGTANTVLRVVATLALFSILIVLVLLARSSSD